MSALNFINEGLEDPLTLGVVCVLVILFAYYFAKTVLIFCIWNSLRNPKKENLLKFLVDENKYTKRIVKDYEKTICFKDQTGKARSSEFAYDYLNLGSVLSAAEVNVNAMSAAAGILVGIGVLGTFIGLTVGLSDIDLTQIKENPDELINGVSTLIAGMKTAFLTSVAGMFLSTVYTLAEKSCFNTLKKRCLDISENLDNKYYISDLEKQEIISERQKNDLVDQVKVIVGELNRNFSATDDQGRDLTIGNMLRDVKSSCEKQRSMIEGVMEEFYDRLSDGLRESALQPLMEKLDELTKAIQNPAASMASSVGEDLRKSILEMIDELKKSVSDATTQRLETFGKQLDKVSGTLESLPDALSKMTGEMKGNMDQMTLQMKTMQGQTNQAGENLVSQQERLNGQSAAIMEEFKKNVQETQKTIEKVSNLLSDFNRLQNTTDSALEKLNDASEKVDDSIKNLSYTQDNLTKTFTDLHQETEQAFEHIREELNHSKDISAQYASEFSSISGSLDKVYREMNEGLNTYTENVKKGTEDFLNTYTKTVTKIAESLTNSYGELSDTLDKMRGARK